MYILLERGFVHEFLSKMIKSMERRIFLCFFLFLKFKNYFIIIIRLKQHILDGTDYLVLKILNRGKHFLKEDYEFCYRVNMKKIRSNKHRVKTIKSPILIKYSDSASKIRGIPPYSKNIGEGVEFTKKISYENSHIPLTLYICENTVQSL